MVSESASWRTNDQIRDTSEEELERYWPHCHAGPQPRLSTMGERWPYAGCGTWKQAVAHPNLMTEDSETRPRRNIDTASVTVHLQA